MASQERPFGGLENVGDAYAMEVTGGAFLGNFSVAGRANLLIALVFATLAAFAAINISNELWLKTFLEKQLSMQKIERIVSEVAAGGHRMRRWETDFFLYSDLKAAAAYEADAARVLGKLETLTRIPEAKDTTTHVDTLSDGIEQHIAQFKKVVNLERTLGLSGGDGLGGRLRDSARALQKILDLAGVGSLTATALFMRSHEKNFILDGDRDHLRRMVELGGAFAAHLAKAPLSVVDKTRISLLMDTYLSDALSFGEVRLSQDVEIKRLGEIFSYVAPNMEALADSASNSAAEASVRLRDTREAARYLGLAGSGSAGILFLVFGISIARSISRPLSEVAAAARLVADGAPSVIIPARHNDDEIGAIARALGVIAESRRIEPSPIAEINLHEGIDRATEGLDGRVDGTIEDISRATAQLETAAVSLAGSIGETGPGSEAAAIAAERATIKFQEVTVAAVSLTGIVSEVSRHATHSAEGVARALSGAEITRARVRKLAEEAQEIGTVADSISETAIQASMLALDATVEAIRGTDASPETSLAAYKINNLASKASLETKRITNKIGEIQRSAEEALDAVASFGKTVSGIDDDAGALVAAVDRQRRTALDIARNVHRAASDTGEASDSFAAVATAISRAGGEAVEVLNTAGKVTHHAIDLRHAVDGVLRTRGGRA